MPPPPAYPSEVACVVAVYRAARAILDEGLRVSVGTLRARGVRGSTAQLIAIRVQLVAEGRLPPEAGLRKYIKSPIRNAAMTPAAPPPAAPPAAEIKPRPGRRSRFTRRMIKLYGPDRLRRQYLSRRDDSNRG